MIHYEGRRILVMGLGLNGGGLGVVQWFIKHKIGVLVTDLKAARELKPALAQIPKSPLVKYRLGEHRLSDFTAADIVIQNPGVPNDSPYLLAARAHGALVINEAIMFFDRCPSRIVAITGTRGKSSTAWFTHQLLKDAGVRNVLTGNIALDSMMKVLDRLTVKDTVIVELSSWHLEKFFDFPLSPDIAVITNIYRDHLNRYKNFAGYIRAKSAI